MPNQEERQHYWHKISQDCPKCSGVMTVVCVCFAADGTFKIDWVCVKCGKAYYYLYTMAACICQAFESDLEATFFKAAS